MLLQNEVKQKNKVMVTSQKDLKECQQMELQSEL